MHNLPATMPSALLRIYAGNKIYMLQHYNIIPRLNQEMILKNVKHQS